MILILLIAYISSVNGQTRCQDNRQCSLTQICVNNICIPNPQFPPICTSDRDCTRQQQCVNGQCVLRPGAGGNGSPCTTINDCQTNFVCTTSGFCVMNPFLTTTTTPTTTTTTRAPPVVTTPAPTCPTGWTRSGNQCYFPVHGSFSNQQAVSFCGTTGTTLVSIPNPQTVFAVSNLFMAGGRSPFWIGLRKIGNQWFWPNGTMATFTNWRPGQPDGCCGRDVTCVVADFSNTAGQWDDAGCTATGFGGQNFGFVCETPVR